MLISHAWLREWVRPAAGPAGLRALADALTMGGLEVAAVTAAGPALGKRVVVGRIAAIDAVPGRPKLKLCAVEVGRASPGPLSIVCAAPNIGVGDKVAVALPGAKLPGAPGGPGGPESATVEKRRIAGIESAGMICSAAELNLEERADGVLQLDADAVVGRRLDDHLDLGDQVLELELTPNRGDCLSVRGVAREVSALLGIPLRAPRDHATKTTVTSRMKLPVELRAPPACPRYAGRAVCGVDLRARAPDWLTERLRRCGARSVNVAVDVTNYVMLELGQPLHAFDLGKLSGGIVVRQARAGEKLRLLDGSRLTLRASHLVIADHDKAVALAGIMGGWDSAVSLATRDIYFESAFFPAAAMLGKARQFGMHTDASHRFERGVDPALQVRALERATQLLVAIAGGEPGPITDACARRFMPRPARITLQRAEIARNLGVQVPAARAAAFLQRLGMQVAPATGKSAGKTAAKTNAKSAGKTVAKTAAAWRVTVPTWRSDVTGAHDLVEEIARLVGYDNIPTRAPAATVAAAARPETRVEVDALKRRLVERGYFEVITYSFVAPQIQRQLLGKRGIRLSNPIAENMAAMRCSLWPGLLDALRGNLNRQHERVRLFETGHVFLAGRGRRKETSRLGAAVTGPAWPTQWGAAERMVDFFDAKGDLQALLDMASGGARGQFAYRPAAHPALHPGRSAQVLCGRKVIGHIGQLHPGHARLVDIAPTVYLFEVDLPALAEGALPAFAAVSRYPAVRRDLAVVVAADVGAQAALEVARAAAGPLLVDSALFDIYAGERLEKNRKSFAFRLTFQSESGNLTAARVDAQTARIVDALQQRFGARLRD